MPKKKLLPSEKIAVEFVLSDYSNKDNFDTILEKVSEDHEDILIWEPFERMNTSEVADQIDNLEWMIYDTINKAVADATKDLLAALQGLYRLIEEGPYEHSYPTIVQAQAAIAKATQQP